MSQPQSRITRNGARSVQDLCDAVGRHVDLSRQFSRAPIEYLQLFGQVFTRMDSSQCHVDAPSGSQQFPCSMGRSLSEVAASLRSNLRRADRSNPENALARFPAAKSLVLLSR